MQELLELLTLPNCHSGSRVNAIIASIGDEEWEPLIQAVIATLAKYPSEPAISILEHVNEERHDILRNYLQEIFLAKNYWSCDGQIWRGGDPENISFLVPYLADPLRRKDALEALLELRLPDAFSLFPQETDPLYFHNVGFSREENTFRQLYPKQIYHLQFLEDYTSYDHETWQDIKERPYRFGGSLEGQHCATCGDTLHHLLTFPAASLLSSTCSLSFLTIATCNHCLGWESRVLFLQHDEMGIPQSKAPSNPTIPELPHAPFEETTVALTLAPERYRWQEWTHKQNIHRLGGHPAWIQQPEYPDCPQCQCTMTFLLQLNSRLPFIQPNPEELGVMEWGSGGVAYFFWCDTCRISAGRWQCT